jgi:hypothetical protein
METFSTDHNGSYAAATLPELQKIEPTLNDTTTATPKLGTVGAEEYTVESTASGSGDTFKLEMKQGKPTRTCTKAGGGTGSGGCPTGSW